MKRLIFISLLLATPAAAQTVDGVTHLRDLLHTQGEQIEQLQKANSDLTRPMWI